MNNKIKYDIQASGAVTIKVVDIIGTPVRVILNEHAQAGSYEVSLDAEALTPGKYYYKVILKALGSNGANGSNGLNGSKPEGETIASGQVKIMI